MKKAFQDMLHELGEDNPVHAYYNGSRSSKDNEDPSWSTSFKTRRTSKTSSLEAALKMYLMLYLYKNRNICVLTLDKLSYAPHLTIKVPHGVAITKM
ncbi:hypothetical protein Tco_0587557 [Tanacetum coccineum]